MQNGNKRATLKKTTVNKVVTVNKTATPENKNKCPYADNCGGCDYQGVPYEKQLEQKQKEMEKLLKPYVPKGGMEKIIGAKHPEHYRNKVHGVFGKDRKGNVFTGIYQEGSHKIVPVKNCSIENDIASKILITLGELVQSFKLQVYDEDRRTGLVRHALIRRGYHTGEVMVVLVLASPVLPSKNNFVKELCKRHPEITTVVLNVNDRRTTMVLGNKNITVHGNGYIEDELCGLRYRISPSSFYQINPEQTEILYNKAMEYAGLTGKERVIDAYCGIGTIGMTAALGQAGKKAKEVIGVELNKEAVKDAISNASANGLKNIHFINDDAGKFMVKYAASVQEKQAKPIDIVFMDPPRSGSTREFIDAVQVLSPKRVVYVSCGPDTLARDLEYFQKKGYKVERVQPVDMFPFTKHCENVCLLSKK